MSLKRTKRERAYGVIPGGPAPDSPRTPTTPISPVMRIADGTEWPSPERQFLPNHGGLKRELQRRRNLPTSRSSLHLARLTSDAMDEQARLQAMLSHSPPDSSSDDSDEEPIIVHRRRPSLRREHSFVHSQHDDEEDGYMSDREDTRPRLRRPATHPLPSSSSRFEPVHTDSDDSDDSDPGLFIGGSRRAETWPARHEREQERAASPVSLEEDYETPYHPGDEHRSPSTTYTDPMEVHGQITSPVTRASKHRRKKSLEAALSPARRIKPSSLAHISTTEERFGPGRLARRYGALAATGGAF
ncbi:hypothetical protein JCM10450v2_002382 [Rhodotorula kratochvilovae]